MSKTFPLMCWNTPMTGVFLSLQWTDKTWQLAINVYLAMQAAWLAFAPIANAGVGTGRVGKTTAFGFQSWMCWWCDLTHLPKVIHHSRWKFQAQLERISTSWSLILTITKKNWSNIKKGNNHLYKNMGSKLLLLAIDCYLTQILHIIWNQINSLTLTLQSQEVALPLVGPARATLTRRSFDTSQRQLPVFLFFRWWQL